MTHVAGFSENSMTFIMVLAGLSMTVGNLMGGKFSISMGSPCGEIYRLLWLPVCLPFSLQLLFLAGSDIDVCMYGRIICRFGPTTIIVTPKFTRGEMMGAACVQVVFNLGNAIGAYAGGLPIDAGLGYRYPALVGVFIVLTVLSLFPLLFQKGIGFFPRYKLHLHSFNLYPATFRIQVERCGLVCFVIYDHQYIIFGKAFISTFRLVSAWFGPVADCHLDIPLYCLRQNY